MKRNYETLDAIVVIGAMAIVAGLIAALVFFDISSEVLPVLSSLGTAVLSLAVAYGAFRWGNSAKHPTGDSGGSIEATITATTSKQEGEG
jgi:hypothetical protein